MRHRCAIAFFAVVTLGARLGAQSPAPVTMPNGDYVIQARDTTKAKEVAIAGWPFVLKGGGYAFDFKSGGCPENAASFDKLLFVSGKPKR